MVNRLKRLNGTSSSERLSEVSLHEISYLRGTWVEVHALGGAAVCWYILHAESATGIGDGLNRCSE